MDIVEDQKLSQHFTLYDLTHTDHIDLQEKNRILDEDQIEKLRNVSNLLQIVEDILGGGVLVSSGYRCPELNAAVGSTPRSQHLLCEAADYVPIGLDLGKCFRILWDKIKAGELSVGQLIYETDVNRFGKIESWLHTSLGEPYRLKERCNEVLRMQNGKYELLYQRTQ